MYNCKQMRTKPTEPFHFPRTARHAAMLLVVTLVLSTLFLPVTTHAAFTARQVQSTDLSAFTKWSSVLARYDYQHAHMQTGCGDARCDNQRWEKLLVELEDKSGHEQLEAINTFFNRFAYVNDSNNWGVKDYWNTPYELMARGGDCEDYAIAKYVSLKRLGMPESDMRIMVVKDLALNGLTHAVLEVKIEGVAYILDNQERRVVAELTISRYHPLYAINEGAWWAFL